MTAREVFVQLGYVLVCGGSILAVWALFTGESQRRRRRSAPPKN